METRSKASADPAGPLGRCREPRAATERSARGSTSPERPRLRSPRTRLTSSAGDAGETANRTPEAPEVGAVTADLPAGLASGARPTARIDGTIARPSQAVPG